MPSLNPGDPPPFHKMGYDVFEEMCCALLAKEPEIAKADLFGRPREPQYGIDVLGEIKATSELAVVSCKCYGTVRKNHMSEWSDDFLKHRDAYWKGRQVRRFILAITADLKSSARQQDIAREKARFLEIGIAYDVWFPRRLQEKLRPHDVEIGREICR